MQIKSTHKSHPLEKGGGYLLRLLRNNKRLRWVVIPAGVAVLWFGSILYSISFGITIKGNHQLTMKWIEGVARNYVNIIPNYIKGIISRPEHIDIDIKHKHFQKIVHQREQAMERRFLVSTTEDWVPCSIRYNGQVYDAEIRLKGDLGDHWTSDTGWSYKIKIKGDRTLFGMKRFAIQGPHTRDYMNEWYLHKLLNHWGLISLRYDFIEVSINGRLQPIYAIEENFEKRLIEHNNRREGPIITFDNTYNTTIVNSLDRPMAPLHDTTIDVYQSSKIAEDETFREQFNAARSLMEQFRQGQLSVAEVFDIERLSLFFAIHDLLGGHHGTDVTNMKFYYNPVTSKLEPIGYDNTSLQPLSREGIWGMGRRVSLSADKAKSPSNWYSAVFKDIEFYRCYVNALDKVSQKESLDEFLVRTDKVRREKLAILHKSYPWYNFEGDVVLYDNQRYIRNALRPEHAVCGYADKYNPQEKTIAINLYNIHVMPTEVTSLVWRGNVIARPGQSVILGPRIYEQQRFNNSKIVPVEPITYSKAIFRLLDDVKWSDEISDELAVSYTVAGGNVSLQGKIINRSIVDERFVGNDFIRQKPNAGEFDFLTVDENSRTIIFKAGEHELAKGLIIPSGYVVRWSGGGGLNLSREGKILSYSPLVFVGTEDEPIIVQSSQDDGQGIVVIQAKGRSRLNHVTFRNLSNPRQGNWQLTGSVTFYESDVDIDHCRFAGNRSEDGLNIIRSDFTITHTLFEDAAADGLDVDFCKGLISDSSFFNSGNDGIDASGSVLKLSNISIIASGDKGISASEASYVDGVDIIARNCRLAVAGKDCSEVNLQNISIEHCQMGLASYQKKPEFGPGVINAVKSTLNDTGTAYLVENRSEIIFNGEKAPVYEGDVKGIVYGNQYGTSGKQLSL